MPKQPALEVLAAPEVGVEYTYGAVAGFLRPTPVSVHFVLVHGPQIVALRVREDYNPQITANPAEVWVGAKGAVSDWGAVLALSTKRVPLFVKKRNRARYTFMGVYEVLDRTATQAKLTKARALMEGVHTQGISRIVFLKKV